MSSGAELTMCKTCKTCKSCKDVGLRWEWEVALSDIASAPRLKSQLVKHVKCVKLVKMLDLVKSMSWVTLQVHQGESINL